MLKAFSALGALLLLGTLSWAGSFPGFEVPQGRNCLTAPRIAFQKGLPDFSVASSASLNPEWTGDQAIVFNCAKPSLRLPLDPWALGRHELKIGYVSGASYVGFSVKVNGKELGKASSSSGKAFPAAVSFNADGLWACGNVLDLEPDGPGLLGLCFIDIAPIEFEEVKASSLAKTSDLEFNSFLLNPVPYSSPCLRLSSEAACELKVNGKGFISCPSGGSVLKQLENPGSRPVELSLKFDGKPAGFKLETTPLGGGSIVSALPAFLDSSFSLDAAPKARISNGIVEATIALPDPVKGYYRGIRFEQAGMVYSLKAGGHEFIAGSLPESHDPFWEVSGPAGEFSEAVGFQEPGLDCFLKIGVGLFERPFAKDYAFGWLFIPKELFKWDCEAKESSIEFRQKVSTPQGWAYEYVKRLSLPAGSSELLVEHSLKNLGTRRLASSHYSHNYFLVDRLPPGPDYSLDCSFRPFFLGRELAGGFVQTGNKVSFRSDRTLFSAMLGSLDAKGSRFVLSHKPSGASVAITELSPAFRQALYVCKEGICPESFVRIDLGPGESASWTRSYQFETK